MPSNWLNVPLLPQHNRANCLPTCIEMVLSYWGQTIQRTWLEQVLESTPFGTSGFKVLNLQRYNYKVIYAPATDDRPIKQALLAKTPPIVLLFTEALPYWKEHTAHAVVVIGLTDTHVIINDPAFPTSPQTVLYDNFMLAWAEFDYLYAIIHPK